MTPIWMFITLILVLIWASMYGSIEIEGFEKTSRILDFNLSFAKQFFDAYDKPIPPNAPPGAKELMDKSYNFFEYFVTDTTELIAELATTTDTTKVDTYNIDAAGAELKKIADELKSKTPASTNGQLSPQSMMIIAISMDLTALKQLADEVPKSIFDKFINIKANTYNGLFTLISDIIAIAKVSDPTIDNKFVIDTAGQYIKTIIGLAPGAVKLMPTGTPFNSGKTPISLLVTSTPPNSGSTPPTSGSIPPTSGSTHPNSDNNYTLPNSGIIPPDSDNNYTLPNSGTIPPDSTTPPTTTTTKCNNTGVEYKNRAGFIMHLGEGAYNDTYYCSQVLGQVKIPRSDGQCGPVGGPQCPDCKGYTIHSPPTPPTLGVTTSTQGNGLEYYNLYWNAKGVSQEYNSNEKIMTSECPECVDKSTGACINCGGNGGSGTIGSDGKSIVPKPVATGIVQDSAGLVKYTASQGVGLVKDTVSGGVGLTKDIVGGVVGLAKDTVTGSVGLAKDTVTGGVDLLKDAASGTKSILTSGPTNPYTYNGALSDKGTSNFIPLTADFSAFGR